MSRDGGKGDTPRPIKDKEQFDKNWDAIFNKGIPTLKQLEELRKGALNPALRTYDGKLE
jgi:hypothetical protein